MDQPTSGELLFRGQRFTEIGSAADEQAYRRAVQLVFQDPFASLNPVFSVAHHLARPLKLHGHAAGRAAVAEAVRALLESVGLDAT